MRSFFSDIRLPHLLIVVWVLLLVIVLAWGEDGLFVVFGSVVLAIVVYIVKRARDAQKAAKVLTAEPGWLGCSGRALVVVLLLVFFVTLIGVHVVQNMTWAPPLSQCNDFLGRLGLPEGSIDCSDKSHYRLAIENSVETCVGTECGWSGRLYSALIHPQGLDLDAFQRELNAYTAAQSEFVSSRMDIPEKAYLGIFLAAFLPLLAGQLAAYVGLRSGWALRLVTAAVAGIIFLPFILGYGYPWIGLPGALLEEDAVLLGIAQLGFALQMLAWALPNVGMLMGMLFGAIPVQTKGQALGLSIFSTAAFTVLEIPAIIIAFALMTDVVSQTATVSMASAIAALMLGYVGGGSLIAAVRSVVGI